jgi:hypothetical protein
MHLTPGITGADTTNQASKFSMKAKLIRVRFIPLLDDAPSLRRERTDSAAGLASSFKHSRHPQS